MFPASLVLLTGAMIRAARAGRSQKGPVIATFGFLVLATPLVTALSLHAGRITFGEAGHLNYAWYINGHDNWLQADERPGVDTRRHQPERIFERPDTFMFPSAPPVTYPPSYDASIWSATARPAFRIADQLRAFRRTFSELAVAVMPMAPILGLMALAALVAGVGRSLRSLDPCVELMAAQLAMIALYLLVHVEGRFIGGQLLILATLGLAMLPRPKLRGAGFSVAAGVVVLAGVFVAPVWNRAARNTALDILHGEQRLAFLHPQNVTESLLDRGLEPGDRIAVIGNTTNVAWAQLGDFHIVAEVPRHAGWLKQERVAMPDPTDPRWPPLLDALQRTGARWIVIRGGQEPTSWNVIDPTRR